ncbi:MAG: hypothetical protein WC551_07730 [Patescibacteria group bacterium]
MTVTASAICLVQSASLGAGWHSVEALSLPIEAGETVSIKLESSAGAGVWRLEIYGADELVTVPTITQASGPEAIASFTAPADAGGDGWALIIKSQIGNNTPGYDASGIAHTEYNFTFKLWHATGTTGRELLALNETFEANATAGWAAIINPVIRAAGGGGGGPPTGAAGGDLGGFYPNPDVLKIHGASVPTSPTSGDVGKALVVSAADTLAYGAIAALTSTAPVDVTKATAAVGTGATAARYDHKHDVATAAAGAAAAGASAAEGTATSLARSDHAHSFAVATPAAVGAASAPGSASTFVRGDHVHGHGDQTGGTLHAVATTSVAGFESAADKTKLDGISAGAAGLSSAAPADVTKAAAAVGVGTTAARSDHKHDISTAAAGVAAAGASAAEGTATSLARSDHAHSFSVATPASVGTANATGSASTFVRGDHVHDHGTQSTGTHHAVATAILNGFMSSTDYSKLAGIAAGATNTPLSSTAPSDVTKAAANAGTGAEAARYDHKHNISTATPIAIGATLAEGTATSLARSDHQHTHGNQLGGTLHAVATTSIAGFMSAADKTNLDGLAGGSVPSSRTISTTAPLTGGGDFSINRTHAIDCGGTSNRALVTTNGTSCAFGQVTAAMMNAGGTANRIFLTTDGSNASWGLIVDAMISGVGWSKIASTPTTVSGYGITDAVATTRSISTTSPLTGGGDLSANRTFAVNTLSNTTSGVVPAITAANTALISTSGTAGVWGQIPDAIISGVAWSKISSKPTTLSGYGITDGVSIARTISTTSPLTGGGDLSANRTIAISAGGTALRVMLTVDGTAVTWGQVSDSYISGVAWSKVSGRPTTLSGYGITDAVAATRTISTTAPLSGGGDLSANRTITVATVSGSSSGVMPAVGANGTIARSDGTAASWGFLTDANVSASAAILGTKISADFRSNTVYGGALAVGTSPAQSGSLRLPLSGSIRTRSYDDASDQVGIAFGYVSNKQTINIGSTANTNAIDTYVEATGTQRINVGGTPKVTVSSAAVTVAATLKSDDYQTINTQTVSRKQNIMCGTGSSGTTTYWYTVDGAWSQNLSAGSYSYALTIDLDIPHGSYITDIYVRFWPQTHTALPASMPAFRFVYLGPAGTSVVTSVTDTSNLATYNTSHEVAMALGAYSVDRTNYAYQVRIEGEYGANSITDMRVQAVRVTYTYTSLMR